MSAAETTLQRMPVKPFYFNTSAHLLRIAKYKANTLSELLDALRDCPEDSIFQHTFRTLEEHHFLRAGFSNDFAHWALAACNEPSQISNRLCTGGPCAGYQIARRSHRCLPLPRLTWSNRIRYGKLGSGFGST